MWDVATAKKFRFVGGNLALDFCNTVGGKRGMVTREKLESYFDFLAWCYQAGLLEKTLTEAAVDRAARHPAEAAVTLARARELREALFRVLVANIEAKSAARSDLALLNAELARSLGRLRLSPAKGDHDGFAWQWTNEPGPLDQCLGPIAHAAGTLLTDPHLLHHVSICGGDTCGWLFIDKSKNHSRRWCDMRDCGNLAKVRRHRLKQRRTRDHG